MLLSNVQSLEMQQMAKGTQLAEPTALGTLVFRISSRVLRNELTS
ncbi:MAG TPA: hypothetical protein VD694_01855 [Nitrososphaeraceae archaeon]|jgi:hypothetical protein|nr:hypothetical protein [Nitrososphaeraceae archaeon]